MYSLYSVQYSILHTYGASIVLGSTMAGAQHYPGNMHGQQSPGPTRGFKGWPWCKGNGRNEVFARCGRGGASRFISTPKDSVPSGARKATTTGPGESEMMYNGMERKPAYHWQYRAIRLFVLVFMHISCCRRTGNFDPAKSGRNLGQIRIVCDEVGPSPNLNYTTTPNVVLASSSALSPRHHRSRILKDAVPSLK